MQQENIRSEKNFKMKFHEAKREIDKMLKKYIQKLDDLSASPNKKFEPEEIKKAEIEFMRDFTRFYDRRKIQSFDDLTPEILKEYINPIDLDEICFKLLYRELCMAHKLKVQILREMNMKCE